MDILGKLGSDLTKLSGWVKHNFFKKTDFLTSSRGAVDAGFPAITDATGKFDSSLIPGGGGGGGSTFTQASDSDVIGSELLTNFSFATDLSGWTADPGWGWNSGKAQHTPGTADTLSQDFSVSENGLYQISVIISATTAGSVQIYTNNFDSYWQKDANGTYTAITFSYATAMDTVQIVADSAFDGSIDSISIKPVTIIPAGLEVVRAAGGVGLELRVGGDPSNVFLGYAAGGASTGTNNIGVGQYALSQSSGGSNLAIGAQALQYNRTGNTNTVIGWLALYANETGSENLAIGSAALVANVSGGKNTAIGRTALGSNVVGNNNTAIGYQAGLSLNANGAVFIGYQAGKNETTANKLHIGNNATLSLLEGVMDASEANQLLQVHGKLGEAWQALPYTNAGGTTWADFGGGFQVGEYKKLGDLVFVRGLAAQTSGAGTTIATLPAGYRPATYTQLFVTLTNGGVGRVDIGTGGAIALSSGGTAWVALNLCFSVV